MICLTDNSDSRDMADALRMKSWNFRGFDAVVSVDLLKLRDEFN